MRTNIRNVLGVTIGSFVGSLASISTRILLIFCVSMMSDQDTYSSVFLFIAGYLFFLGGVSCLLTNNRAKKNAKVLGIWLDDSLMEQLQTNTFAGVISIAVSLLLLYSDGGFESLPLVFLYFFGAAFAFGLGK